MLFAFTNVHGANRFRHTPARHHCARQMSRLADVIVGPGAEAAEGFFLRRPTGQHDGEAIVQILLGKRVAFDFRQLLRGAEGTAARNNAHFEQRIRVRQIIGDRRMPSFVNG